MNIRFGIITIGNTRFLTIFYAAEALLLCMPAIKELVKSQVLKLNKKSGILWMTNKKDVVEFEDRLLQLKTLLEPLARAVQCLESLQSNPADVYLFWLAIMATHRDLFSKNEADLGLPDDVVTEIRSIMNFRYTQMIDNPSHHVYLTTFFLDFRG